MKLFVWDLHGVLEKGNEIALLKISNIILHKFGYPQKLSINDCKRLNGLPWYQYFALLLPQEDTDTHMLLQNACLKYSHENFFNDVTKYLTVNEHAIKVLETIANSSHDQILISNTESDALTNYLSILKIDKFFIEGRAFATNVHKENSTSKKVLLEKHLSTREYDKIISIGDSPNDIVLADLHKNGTSYLYAHKDYPFRNCKATYKINDLRKILIEI